MSDMQVASKTSVRQVADFSADFEVEDVKRVGRPGRERRDPDVEGGIGAPLPLWQKSPKAAAAAAAAKDVVKQPIADLDPHRLGQRQKQIDYGKNTIGYQRYLQQVPKNKRRKKGDQWLDPVTPDINQNISKRCFDGQVKVWRRALHKYDIEPEEDEQQIKPMSYAERSRHAALVSEDAAVMSAAPSSPTNSSKSRGSLDGYMEPQVLDGGRKRCFETAFDQPAAGNPHPSKLLTSPAGPKPAAPQSAPPATAADSEPAPTPAGRCIDPPMLAAPRTGGAPANLPKAPQTAPPAAAPRMIAAGTTAEPRDARGGAAGPRGQGGRGRGGKVPPSRGDELFREWVDEECGGLPPLDDDEMDRVLL